MTSKKPNKKDLELVIETTKAKRIGKLEAAGLAIKFLRDSAVGADYLPLVKALGNIQDAIKALENQQPHREVDA